MKLWLNVREGLSTPASVATRFTRPASVARSDTRVSVDDGPFAWNPNGSTRGWSGTRSTLRTEARSLAHPRARSLGRRPHHEGQADEGQGDHTCVSRARQPARVASDDAARSAHGRRSG